MGVELQGVVSRGNGLGGGESGLVVADAACGGGREWVGVGGSGLGGLGAGHERWLGSGGNGAGGRAGMKAGWERRRE